MADRTFDLQVSGYSKGGYGITVTARDVEGDKLLTALAWLGEKVTESGLLPLQAVGTPGDNGSTPDGETHLCLIHKVPMERHDKGRSHWYSHKVVEVDGTERWCRGK